MVEISESIFEQYDIGRIQSIARTSSGLVHVTFLVTTDQGKYIIQKLHPILSSDEIAEDFLAVTTFLNEVDFPVPECVLTKEGKVLAKHGDEVWRMQTAINGESFDRIDDLQMLKQAGQMLGRFHRSISTMPTAFKSDFVLPPNPQVVLKDFLEVIEDNEEVQAEIDLIKEQLPSFILPEGLPQHNIHGDPKVSNFLFASKTCVGVIDLDTCNRQSVLMELGDAFRSWCAGEEDDSNNVFSVEKFSAAWEGYVDGSGDLLTDQERKLVPQAIGLVTIELACRFLTDYFNDSYFGWDDKRYDSRQAHNLARCRGQIAEFHSFEKQKETIDEIVSK